MSKNDDFKEIGRGSLAHEQADERIFYDLQEKNKVLQQTIVQIKCMLLLQEQKFEFLLQEFYLLADSCRDDRFRKRVRRWLDMQERGCRRVGYRQSKAISSIFYDDFYDDITRDKRYYEFGRGSFDEKYF